VSAAAAGDVWAVGEGDSSDISTGVTLAMRWTGTRWRTASTPNDGSGANALYAVTAVSDTDVWAVGESDAHGALILHYDGAAWSIVPNAAPPGDSALYSVAAASVGDVWAVGYAGDHTLAEHWDGTRWAAVASPNGAEPASLLAGVATAGPGSEVWSVGYTYDALTVAYRTLTERWNGSAWKLVASPNPDPDYDALQGVAAGAGGIWAVGATGRRTLALLGV
jgi:hypothetical protein